MTGIVLGKAYGAVEQQIDTSNTSTTFDEHFHFELLAADVGTAGMTAEIDAVCSLDTSCRQGSGPWGDVPTPVSIGVPLEGTWQRTWTGDRGHKEFIIDYDLTIRLGGYDGYTGWGGNLEPGDGLYKVRCDNEIGASAGCVVPAFAPTFTVNFEKYPAASDYIDDAQAYIKTHPGDESHSKGTPLHRESDTAIAKKNRDKVCDSTFVAEDKFNGAYEIQCDEYPFAATKESGGQLGITSGKECKQFVIHPGYVEFYPHTPHSMLSYQPSGTANCARASMPKHENEGVGGDLGRFAVSTRLLEDDAYWVNAASWSEMCGCIS